ncbi:MAG: dTDP-4-dehydrorhamnose 3,5-epimerase [Clostridia bacterium]|nr:dTDP-4-dehydrorhamnose 3,5-epimerase [Clostridia bacterium]
MGKLNAQPVNGFEGLYVLTPAVYSDARGSFSEVYNRRDFEEAGIRYDFVQENQIRSFYGALRGMHFQRRFPQAKLIRVISGTMLDVAVDLRPESASFGKWFALEMSGENGKLLLIPRGFAHGCLTLSDEAVCSYLCDDFYVPGDEGGFMWNDPAIGIAWPELRDGAPPLLSEKDRVWPPLLL